MHTEKKAKVDISIINNPDFINLSFSKFFSSLFEIHSSQLIKIHQQFNPFDFWKKFKQDYNHNNLFENCKNLVKFLSFSFIYAFIPGWFFLAVFETIFSTIFWQFTITKIQIVINQHRLSIRTSVITNPFNLPTVLGLFPFLIGFAYFFNKKYPDHLTQYFFEKNLPGVSLPTEKLNWDTVQYLLKPNLKKENFNNVQIECQDNSLIFNINIFDDYLGQKIFINKYKKNSINQNPPLRGDALQPPASIIDTAKPCLSSDRKDKFNLLSGFSNSKTDSLFFHNLDELPAYLESFSNGENVSLEDKKNILLKVKNLYPSKVNYLSFGNRKISKKQNKQNSLKQLTKLIFQFSQDQELITKTQDISNFNSFLGLKIPQEKKLLSKNFDPNFGKSLLATKYLSVQQEFQNLWNLFQSELKTVFLNNNAILISLNEIQNSDFSERIDSEILKYCQDVFSGEENILMEEILSYLTQKEIVNNPFETRRMSGYRYPDMTTSEIGRLFLQQKLTRLAFSAQPEKSFLQLKFPSTFVETNQYDFHLEPFPNFSIFTKPLVLKDFETDKILYQGPGVILEKNTGFDWKTELINQYPGNTLRFWFQRYISPYTAFMNSNKHFIGIYDLPQVSSDSSSNDSQNHTRFVTENKQNLHGLKDSEKNNQQPQRSSSKSSALENWLQNLPGYKKQNYSNIVLDIKERSKYEKVTNLNEFLFPLETTLNVPYISAGEWKKQYEKICKKTDQLKDSDSQSTGFDFFTVPVIQSRIPKSDQKLPQIHSQISLDNTIDYKFGKNLLHLEGSNLFSLKTESQFQGILEKENFENFLNAGIYKKIPSIFASKTAVVNAFQDNWEPLSFQSWLIISQLSFAFFVFQILKNLYSLYGTELLGYFIDLVATTGVLDDESKQQIEILMGTREKGFRIISKSRKKFFDIAGIQTLLPELSEIVWFLRNSARNFSTSTTLPRGILLVGPPGTGKTVLVQAIAGESNVPVVALSGSSLVEPGESAALKLELAFEEARRLSPCIVFIDEIDTLGQKREQVMQNPMANDDLLEVVTHSTNLLTVGPEFGKLLQLGSFRAFKKTQSQPISSQQDETSVFATQVKNLEIEITQQTQAQQQLEGQQLHLLVQLLVELDGLKSREGVIVIGATNRPEMLDPALLRPGRFDRVLQLGLPASEKRIEILKFYGQKLGYDKSISWNYFAERTVGFSAADLASIMNVSSLKAIMNNTYHTLESIEHGIDRIMTSESQKDSSGKRYLFENIRFAYYQAGKIICTSLLEYHPPIVVAQLWTRRPNLRSLKIAQNLENYFFRLAQRSQVEHRIIGSYSGKVGEIIFLQKLFSLRSKRNFNEFFNINLSTLGLEDLSFAQVLIKFLVEKWYIYSSRALTHKATELSENRNFQELSQEKILLFNQICQNLESSPRPVGELLPGPFDDSEEDETSENENENDNDNVIAQHTFSIPWWQHQISSQLEFVERNFPKWYRIYLANPQEIELNPDWLPPDEYYHRNQIRESVASDSSWNDLGSISQDYQTHSLVLQSFNKAFVLVDQHRELLDVIAFKLLNEKILRQWDIISLFQQYNFNFNPAKFKLNLLERDQKVETDTEVSLNVASKITNQKVIVNSAWGNSSRRKNSNWIDFKSLL